MLLVADASVIVSALADRGPTGDADRSRLIELAAGQLHIVQNFTETDQPMRHRVSELRNNMTVYDAAYIALVQRLESEHKSPAALATGDLRLMATPGLAIRFEAFAEFGRN